MLENKCKKCLGAENNALKEMLYYILEVLSLFGYNTVSWQYKYVALRAVETKCKSK